MRFRIDFGWCPISLRRALGLLQDLSDKRENIDLTCVERRQRPGQDPYLALHWLRWVHKDLIGPFDFTQTSPNGKFLRSQFLVDNLNSQPQSKILKIFQNPSGLHVDQPLAALSVHSVVR